MTKNYYLIAIIVLAVLIFVTTIVIQNLPIGKGGLAILPSACIVPSLNGAEIGCIVVYSGYVFLLDVALLLVIVYLMTKFIG